MIRVEGVRSLRTGDGNELLMGTPAGILRQTAPVAWQEASDGTRSSLTCRFRLIDGQRYGFEVEDRDPDQRLIVDPGIIWSTYLGGAADDFARSVQLHASGEVLVAGQAQSLTPPTALLGTGGGWDGFVARFRPYAPGGGAAQLLWLTCIGGSSDDMVLSMTHHINGMVDLTGRTSSAGPLTGFPVTAGAFQPSLAGGTDAFIAELDGATGANLNWSSYFGGIGHEVGLWIENKDEVRRVVGYTDSPGLPTTLGAFQPTLAGGRDAFVACFDPTQIGPAQLVYLTYLGGSGDEGTPPASYLTYTVKDIIVSSYGLAPAGQVTVAGVTASADFPTLNAYQPAYNQIGDVFVCRLDLTQAGAQQLVWSTYLGGPASDVPSGLGVDSQGRVTVSGSTRSAQFPVTASSAFQPVHASAANGLPDGFVARLDPSQPGPSQLVYSTFIG
jgi:hypothetical protein